jgi:phosphohistidine phosphatase
MIRIAIIRHCEASNGYDDFLRPLSPNGLAQVPRTADFLRQSGMPLNRLVCSPATRTRDTARLIAAALDWKVTPEEKTDLYNPSTLTSLHQQIAEAVDGLVLVGHNPGLVDLIFELSSIDVGLPPSGAVILGLENGRFALIARHLC